jgi:hypothetical protein
VSERDRQMCVKKCKDAILRINY